MNISIFGLGYVGATLAGCLARSGHFIYGVDPAIPDIATLLSHRAVINEPDLREYIEHGWSADRLHLTGSRKAIRMSDVTIVCVGTPPNADGAFELTQLENAMREIGAALKMNADIDHKGGYHLVIVRSTVLPGTTRAKLAPILEHESGSKVGDGDLELIFQPEFLREGSACADFFTPPFTVIGWLNGFEPLTLDVLKEMYVDVDTTWQHLKLESAEMLKLVCNTWHALKVCFANEIGALCGANGINGAEVMDAFARDHKLNLSPAYLRPGFAYGGPCLPKDLDALLSLTDPLGGYLPLISRIGESNWRHVQRVISLVQLSRAKRIGVVGLTHKPGTGDLRGSMAVFMIDQLKDEGYQALGYDSAITRADYSLATNSLAELVALSDVLVVTHAAWLDQARATALPVIDVSGAE